MQPLEYITLFLLVVGSIWRFVLFLQGELSPPDYPGPAQGYPAEVILGPDGMREFVADMVKLLTEQGDTERLARFLAAVDPIYHPTQERQATPPQQPTAEEFKPEGPDGEWSVEVDAKTGEYKTIQVI